MPDLRRMTARAAFRTLAELGVRAQLTGSGVVVRQEPAVGTACAAIGDARAWLEPGGGYVPVVQGAPAATEVRR